MNEILHNLEKSILKLEYGQKDIKSGQANISKKVTLIEEALSELKELKESFMETKQNAAEQTMVIKEIRKNLKDLRDIQKQSSGNNAKNKEAKNTPKTFHGIRDPFDRPKEIIYDSENNSTSPTEKVSSRKFTTVPRENSHIKSKKGTRLSKSESLDPQCITDVADKEVIFDCHDDNMLHRYLKESAQFAEKRVRTASRENRDAVHFCKPYKEKFNSATTKKETKKLSKKMASKGDKWKRTNAKLVSCEREGKVQKKRSSSQGKKYEDNNKKKLYGKYPCMYCNKVFCFSKNFSEHMKTCRQKHQNKKTSDDDNPTPLVKK